MPPDARPKSTGGGSHVASRLAQQDPAFVRWLLILACVAVMGLLVVLPVVAVFAEAFREGFATYWANITEPDTLHSIGLTLFVAPIVVVVNVIFGLAAAWAISRFQFRGRTILTTMIDLPFAVSAVVVGLAFMLLFGQQGLLGPWLKSLGIEVAFNVTAIILVTTFVTLPAGATPATRSATGEPPVVPLTEVTIVRSDGTLRQVESLGTPVEYGGGQATLMVMRDILLVGFSPGVFQRHRAIEDEFV